MRRPVMVAAALAGGVAAGAAAMPGAAKWLVVSVPLARCDLMVVLAGGARERLATAVDLMAGGACGRVLFTGEGPGDNLKQVRDWIEGIPRGRRIEPALVSRDTFGDAVTSLRAAREGGFRSVLVVTSPYHTRRAAWVLSRVFAGSGVEVGVYPSGSLYMDYERWWVGLHGLRSVLGEYAKLWLYGLVSMSLLAGASSLCA